MAESKSTDFLFAINAHSEKYPNFHPFPINGLEADSECAPPGRMTGAPNPKGSPSLQREGGWEKAAWLNR
jgi:hypothetical protein